VRLLLKVRAVAVAVLSQLGALVRLYRSTKVVIYGPRVIYAPSPRVAHWPAPCVRHRVCLDVVRRQHDARAIIRRPPDVGGAVAVHTRGGSHAALCTRRGSAGTRVWPLAV
jgi:hypothetical protein